jgi:hypothetical protein
LFYTNNGHLTEARIGNIERSKDNIAKPSTSGTDDAKPFFAKRLDIYRDTVKEEMRNKSRKVTSRKRKTEIENVKMSSKVVASGWF